jgi:hypothetical protein
MDRRAESGRIGGAFHMKMTAMFHIALLPDASKSAFITRVTDHEYDFVGNVERAWVAIKGMGVVTDLEVYTHLGARA